MKILITGGTGFVGRNLSSALIQNRHDVTLMARKTPRDNIDFVKCDMLADVIKPEMVAGKDAIVHLAGVPVFTRWSNSYKQLIWRSRIETAQKLIDVILALPANERPKVVVSASGVGYYGEQGQNELTENSAAGTGFLAEVCVAWERIWEPLNAIGIRIVTIRTGVVIGAGGGIMGALLPFYKLGLGPIVGNGKAYFSWIAMEDLIRIYTLAIEEKRICGPINAVSPNPVTYKEFAKTIGKAVGRPVFLYSPIWLMDIGLNGAAKEGFASAKVLPTALSQMNYIFLQPGIEGGVRVAALKLR